jgi:hypothetical protein
MATTVLFPSLRITTTTNFTQNQRIIDNYAKGVKRIIQVFGQRASETIIQIAPDNRNQEQSKGSNYRKTKRSKYSKLADSIYTKYGTDGFEVDVRSSTGPKALMQEYGYPYEDPFWKAPYRPNPKRKEYYAGTLGGNIKNVGYLRAGVYIAGESLLSDRINYSTKVTASQVVNFNSNAADRFKQILEKYTLAYFKGKSAGLPAYIREVVEFPEVSLVSKFTSRLGSFKSLEIAMPINIGKLAINASNLAPNFTQFSTSNGGNERVGSWLI